VDIVNKVIDWENGDMSEDGDSIAGSSITVPASQYVAGMPGKVVIPEDEIRLLMAEYPMNVWPVPMDINIPANDDLNSLNSHFDTTEDYWTVHNG
jgi:hypothetical protein